MVPKFWCTIRLKKRSEFWCTTGFKKIVLTLKLCHWKWDFSRLFDTWKQAHPLRERKWHEKKIEWDEQSAKFYCLLSKVHIWCFQVISRIQKHYLPMKTFGTVCCPVSLSSNFCTCGPWAPEGNKVFEASLITTMMRERRRR